MRKSLFLGAGILIVLGVLVWQAVNAHGVPDPTSKNLTPTAAIVETGILVFREGLEAILVLAAITASLVRTQKSYWKPIAVGSGLSFAATLVTWFIVVAAISAIRAPELDVQAGTGLLAIVVLLIIMNWFFHKIYWTGWITHHNKRKRELTESNGTKTSSTYIGLVLLGFTAIYREGFEVVLFLQNLRMQVGSTLVLDGTLIGLGLTSIVAVLTFIAHRKLPYKKMLVLTGVMLAIVLMVMVGESVQEMQLAQWISTTALPIPMPGWMNLWFAVYPSLESLCAQAFALVLVVGSYFAAEHVKLRKPRKQQTANNTTVNNG